jgi:hypothetical protein
MRAELEALDGPGQLAAALAHDATSIGIADNLLQQLTEAKADVAKVIRARNFYEQLWKEAEGKLTAALKEAAPEGLASELEKDAEHLGDTGLHGIAMRVEQAAAALRRPEGVWVPKEPTEAMIEAWDRPKAGGQSFHHLFVANYKAMLAAAQEEKAS